MNKYSGGPAFPGLAGCYHNGMSLRDWFAGKVLGGEVASQSDNTGEWKEEQFATLAKRCYKIADAMLAERSKNDD